MEQKKYAQIFNMLLGISPGYFGSSPKSEPGAGVLRARARLAAKLKANKAIPSSERVTRQQIRAQQRKEAKTWRETPAAAHRASINARRQRIARERRVALAVAGAGKLPPDPGAAMKHEMQ